MLHIAHAPLFAPEVEDALFDLLAERPDTPPTDLAADLAARAACSIDAIRHWLALPETQADLRAIRSAAHALDTVNHIHAANHRIDTHFRIIDLTTSETFHRATPAAGLAMLTAARTSAKALHALRDNPFPEPTPSSVNASTSHDQTPSSRDEVSTSHDRKGAGSTRTPIPPQATDPHSPELRALLAALRTSNRTRATGGRPKENRQRVAHRARSRPRHAPVPRPVRCPRCTSPHPHRRLSTQRLTNRPQRTCALTTPDPNHPS